MKVGWDVVNNMFRVWQCKGDSRVENDPTATERGQLSCFRWHPSHQQKLMKMVLFSFHGRISLVEYTSTLLNKEGEYGGSRIFRHQEIVFDSALARHQVEYCCLLTPVRQPATTSSLPVRYNRLRCVYICIDLPLTFFSFIFAFAGTQQQPCPKKANHQRGTMS